jgi:hypothetical protein
MQYFMSVIADGTELATPSEMDAIDAFNDKLRAGGYWVYANGLAEPNSATVIDGLVTSRSLPTAPSWSRRSSSRPRQAAVVSSCANSPCGQCSR